CLCFVFFFSSRRRHTRFSRDWSSDVCSSDLGLAGFEGRASVRTWLYHVATSRCLDALRSASRRPLMSAPPPGLDPPEPTRLGEEIGRASCRERAGGWGGGGAWREERRTPQSG